MQAAKCMCSSNRKPIVGWTQTRNGGLLEKLCSDLVHCWALMKTGLKWNRYFAAFCILASLLPALAQQTPPEFKSPQVNADRTITFRFLDPGAQKVSVNVEGAKPLDMTKDAQGVW